GTPSALNLHHLAPLSLPCAPELCTSRDCTPHHTPLLSATQTSGRARSSSRDTSDGASGGAAPACGECNQSGGDLLDAAQSQSPSVVLGILQPPLSPARSIHAPSLPACALPSLLSRPSSGHTDSSAG